MVKKNSLFGKEIKKKIVSLEPQPEEGQLLGMKRFYGKLKRDKNYKKRISWFEQLPGYPKETNAVAVVEYLGTFPFAEISKHGNAR